MKQHKDCNFSYAGLKTQVRLAIESQNLYVVHFTNSIPIPETDFPSLYVA